MKKKPAYIPGIKDKIQVEETLMGLLKEKFVLMRVGSELRSDIHFCIAVGDHSGTEIKSKKLKDIEDRLAYLTYRIAELSSEKKKKKLQTL